FVGDQRNELRIDLAASDKRRRPHKPLHGDAQSGMDHRLRLDDCGAAISKRKHPESHSPAPQPSCFGGAKAPPSYRIVRFTRDLSQGSRWASRLADSGRAMIVLVASCGPCMATGTGRT